MSEPGKQQMLDVVTRLLNVQADLVVTITAPLDRRRPHNEADRIALRNLVADATAQVRERSDDPKPIVAKLDEAAGSVDLVGSAHGVVIVATAELAEAHLLQFPVVTAVELGTTPATRSLVQGLRRSPRYRVLALSEEPSRLFEGVREDLDEVTAHGLPMSADIVPRDMRAVAGRFARQPGGDDQEQRRSFYRSVDEALSAAGRNDPLPIVLAGVERAVTTFTDVSDNTAHVVGHLDGAHDQTSAHDLGLQGWQVMRERLKARRVEAVAELSEASHSGKAVTGIDEVWQMARQGRGHQLIVEEDYRSEPATEGGDHRLVPAQQRGPGVMDDPVDELIEHVVRANGSVEFVGSGALSELGSIGLMLR